MDWRNKLTGRQIEDHAEGEVMFTYPLTQLKVLVKHGSQRQRDGLYVNQQLST